MELHGILIFDGLTSLYPSLLHSVQLYIVQKYTKPDRTRLTSLSGKHHCLHHVFTYTILHLHNLSWHTHFAWPSHTEVCSVHDHLYCRTWCQPGLWRGLESKLILANESTSNTTRLIHIDQSQLWMGRTVIAACEPRLFCLAEWPVIKKYYLNHAGHPLRIWIFILLPKYSQL